jgi:pyridoxal phosphate enzyme (YggS family)
MSAPRPAARRLAANLRDVRERIAAAARGAGRDVGELTLVAVSKTWPAEDVIGLRALGVTDFAENREQEAAPKVAAVAAALGAEATAGPVWHFVGQLQRNKASAVARWADWVQSVDRLELVAALARAAVSSARQLTICIQVSLDPPGGAGTVVRGGAAPADVPKIAEMVAAADGLRLAGVMAVAPRGEPPRPAFARLREVAENLSRDYPDARVISAGMSGDLEAAVAEGATHLRIGTALFGERLFFP